MKKRAFTLIEILISISILSIAVGIASLIFGTAIRQPKQLQPAKIGSANASSQMEQKLNELKYDSSISGAEEYNAVLKFGEINRRPKGIFISFDGNIKSGNEVKPEHGLITYVGEGHHRPGIPLIKHVYFTNDKRFIYMPMFNYETKTQYGSTYTITKFLKDGAKLSAKSLTDYHAETHKYLKKIRMKILGSQLHSGSDYRMTPVYTDSGFGFLRERGFTESAFNYLQLTFDGADEVANVFAEHIFPGYLSNRNQSGQFVKEDGNTASKLSDIRKDKRKDYLDYIDRDYILESSTLNINGFTSPLMTSLEDDLRESDAKNRVVRIIGLPFLENLLAYYNYNLAIGKSTSENKYYSLFDLDNVAKTDYGYAFSKSGNKYEFDWRDKDVLDMTYHQNTVPNHFKISKGFVNSKNEESALTGNVTQVSDVKKSYGNTVYYSWYNGENTKPVIAYAHPKADSKTIIMKLKINHEDRNNKAPFSLISSNMKKDGKKIDMSKAAFSIYADTKGDLHYLYYRGDSGYAYGNPLNVNLYDKSLYVGTNAKFNKMGSSERDDREDFIILSFTFQNAGLMVDILRQEEVQKSGEWKIETSLQNIYGEYSWNGGYQPKSVGFYGVDINFDLLSDIDSDGRLPLANHDKNAIAELSDVMLYNDVLYKRYIYQSVNDLRNLVMDYLYRSFLTEYERKEGGFDDFYIHKYRHYHTEQPAPTQ